MAFTSKAMEKGGIFGPAQSALSWPSAPSEMNWDNSVVGNAPPFDSALSSMVSSPSSSDPAAPSDGLAIRELIGRLGTICGGADASASCYATPLSSPPKLNLSIVGDHHHHRYQQQFHLVPVPVAADPGFAERAARLSCFNSAGGYGGILEAGKLSRAPSSRSMKTSGSQDDDQELANAREESSVSDPNSGTDSNARKRKAARKGKAKDATSSMATKMMEEEEDSSVKRSRSVEMANAVEPKAEENGGGHKQGKESLDAKPPETPKQDYIHVRARRGQATDRHSLAERVRREKISERMKLLQDLVPGCNKIIGKAVMLDEIINYVQSLQRQVEFLSMKLATLNPHLDLGVENLLQKDMHQACGPSPNSVHLLEASAAVFSYPHQPQQAVPFQCVEPTGVESQCSVNQLGFTLPPTLSLQRSSLDGFGDAVTQGVFLENDLQSFVQMGFLGQNPEAALSSHNFHGQLPPAHMKNEF